MITKMYYDAFTNEYTLNINKYAPPERYCPTLRGENQYIDHWESDDGRCLDISYTVEEYYADEHDRRYRSMCEEYNFNPVRLRCFTLPAIKFDKYVERFGLKEN